MEYPFQFQKLFQIEKRRWLFVVGLVAITHLLCQSLLLPYDLTENTLFVGMVKDGDGNVMVGKIGQSNAPMGVTRDMITNFKFDGRGLETNSKHEDENVDEDFVSEDTLVMDESFALENIVTEDYNSTFKKANETMLVLSINQTINLSDGISADHVQEEDPSIIPDKVENISSELSFPLVPSPPVDLLINKATVGEQIKVRLKDEKHVLLQSDLANSTNDSAMPNRPVKKKMKSEMPPKSITTLFQMNRLLVRHRVSSRAMRPRRPSVRDQEILAAKFQIERAPTAEDERELYAPLFRNVSMFKRSYELMERTLKVYVYKDGDKPIFHQPMLKGLYASEGWFMKLMEGNRRFVVKDPQKAHLFYMPFSSRMLEYTLYVRNSHNRTNLRQYLKIYSEKIAAKYPFWNRTGGSDHFLVACHDWAPYETRHHMEHCIKALCNADVTAGFKVGRDVSLPETYVRSARNPLRDLGGKPPSLRHILAFYAGNMHGYLRPILLKYWKDKDPVMKIFGPMPPGVASKMNYIQHMKSSKYCICPKGYEVNSPRVVEAIFYECIPVIISDNFVPPFFEVLNWSAFSVILAEKDIPNLKDILLSISEEKYREMQFGVRKAQRHFLWHVKPAKYDLFHMTLHSIWYNRVFQIKVR